MFVHGFGNSLIMILFVISALAAFLDMRRYSDAMWKEANESKAVWYVLGTVAGWPVGALVYFFVVRPKLDKLFREDAHEGMKARMFAEWDAEQQRRAEDARAQRPPAAPPVTPSAPASAGDDHTTVLPTTTYDSKAKLD